MRKLLLTLLLLATTGCMSPEEWEDFQRKTSPDGLLEIERIEQCKKREAMLRDGTIHIGMADSEFARLWERPWHHWIDRSVSAYGVTEWWEYNTWCTPTRPGLGRYYFCFDNGILVYWSEN